MILLSLTFISLYMVFALFSLSLFHEGLCKSIGIGDSIAQITLGIAMAMFAYGFLVLAYGVTD